MSIKNIGKNYQYLFDIYQDMKYLSFRDKQGVISLINRRFFFIVKDPNRIPQEK